MSISNLQAKAVLTASAARTRSGVSGDATLGGRVSRTLEMTGRILYTVEAIFWDTPADASLDLSTGVLTTSTAEVRGTQQVETATVVGTITLAGNATVTVTAANMTGSPKAISVAVALNDTAAMVAGKIRTALAADSAVAAMFTVGGTGADVTLTRKEGDNGERYANDGTLNVAYTNGTCTGLTPDASSADTAAGVASSGTQIVEGADGEDFEGRAISADDSVEGLLIERVDEGDAGWVVAEDANAAGNFKAQLQISNAFNMGIGWDLLMGEDLDLSNVAAGVARVKVHVLGAAA